MPGSTPADWYAAVVFGYIGTMDQEQKGQASCGIYTYKHHYSMEVDIHEILVKKSRLRVVLSYIGVVFLLVNVSQPLLAKV
jgi:phosphatidylinositol glycan class H protein